MQTIVLQLSEKPLDKMKFTKESHLSDSVVSSLTDSYHVLVSFVMPALSVTSVSTDHQEIASLLLTGLAQKYSKDYSNLQAIWTDFDLTVRCSLVGLPCTPSRTPPSSPKSAKLQTV